MSIVLLSVHWRICFDITLYLYYILRSHSPFVQVSRRKTNLIVPVDGEGVEAERLEVVEIL